MKMIGVIFAGLSDQKKYDLIKKRTASSLPIAGNYHAIDFSLSCMVNSGVGKVAIISQYSTRKLREYLTSSIWWGFGRKQGGLYLLSPEITESSREWYKGKVDSMYDNLEFFTESHEPYVVLAMGDGICKMDYNDVLNFHIEKNAEITAVCVKPPKGVDIKNYNEVTIEKGGRITGITKNPRDKKEEYVTSGIYIIRRRLLIDILKKAKKGGRYSMVEDIIIPRLCEGKVYAYIHEGYWSNLATEQAYMNCNMDFLKKEVMDELLGTEPQIYTRDYDNPPAKYLAHAKVSGSLIGDGAVIDGKVTKSVIFAGATIEKGAVVKNSLVLPGAIVSEGEEVDGAIVKSKN